MGLNMGKLQDYFLNKYANSRTFDSNELYCGIIARSYVEKIYDEYGYEHCIRVYRPYKFAIMKLASIKEKETYLDEIFFNKQNKSSIENIPLNFQLGDYFKAPTLNNEIIPQLYDNDLIDEQYSPLFLNVICTKITPLNTMNTQNFFISPKLSLSEIAQIEELVNRNYDLDEYLGPTLEI